MSDYALTISEHIINLLKKNLPQGLFRQFYNGDIGAIPQSSLPCVAVVKTGSSYDQGPTGMDNIKHTITVRVIFNKKDEFGKSADEAVLQKTIENIIEGVDPDTNETSPYSILGILRKNFTLENVVINNTVDVRYTEVNTRPTDLITQEGEIRFVFQQFRVVSGRV